MRTSGSRRDWQLLWMEGTNENRRDRTRGERLENKEEDHETENAFRYFCFRGCAAGTRRAGLSRQRLLDGGNRLRIRDELRLGGRRPGGGQYLDLLRPAQSERSRKLPVHGAQLQSGERL